MLQYTHIPAPVKSNLALQGPFSQDHLLALETVEARFYRDLYNAVSSTHPDVSRLHHLCIETAWAYLAPTADVLGLNKVLAFGLAAPAEKSDLAWIISAYRDAGVPRFFLQMSPAAGPPVLYNWMLESGFRLYNNWVKLHRSLATPAPAVETRLRIERIDRVNASVFGELVATPFDWPDVLASALAGTVERPGWRHYFAFDGEAPVAAAALFMHDGYAYLGPAATCESHRRQGAQRALIARRLNDAKSLGCHSAITDTAEPRPDKPVASYRNMRHMGFTPAYTRPNYLFTF